MENEIYNNYFDSIPPVKIVSLARYASSLKLDCTLLGGIMFDGATGSCMDALARGMVNLAIEKGALKPGMSIIEASSGSFGTALALLCTHLGIPLTLVMPSTISFERQNSLAKLGANIVITSPIDGRRGAIKRAKELAEKNNAYFLNYFENDDNPEYHRRFTGPAILNAVGPDIDYIVIGVGSAGTITGVGEYAKAWTTNAKIIAVEPFESSVLSGGFAGKHGISGLGCGFVPENYNPYIVDEVIEVSTGDANSAANKLMLWEQIPAAVSSGAAIYAASKLAIRSENAGKKILVLLGSRKEY